MSAAPCKWRLLPSQIPSRYAVQRLAWTAARTESCRGKSSAPECWGRSAPPCPAPAVTRGRGGRAAHAIRINYRWLTRPEASGENKQNRFNFHANLLAQNNLPKIFSRSDRSETFAARETLSWGAWSGLWCRSWAQSEASTCCCCWARLCCCKREKLD